MTLKLTIMSRGSISTYFRTSELERYVDHQLSSVQTCYDFGDVWMQLTTDLLPVFIEISVAFAVELHHDFFLVACLFMPSQDLEVVYLLTELLLSLHMLLRSNRCRGLLTE